MKPSRHDAIGARPGKFSATAAISSRLARLSKLILQGGLVCLTLIAVQEVTGQQPPPIDRIKLPPGFEIGVFSANVPGARSLALGKSGVVFVGTQRDAVYAVRYRGDRAERVLKIASGL